MKWEEVRKTYPNTYVVVTAIESHIIGNKKYIDEMSVVRKIDDPGEATKVLVKCKGDTFVYHTGKEEVVMEIVNNPVYRGVM